MPRKKLYIKNKAKYNYSVEVEILNETLISKQLWIKAKNFHNPTKQLKMRIQGLYDLSLIQRLKIDLNRISDKILSDQLVKPMQKLAKLITKTISTVHKLKSYNKAVNNTIDKNR